SKDRGIVVDIESEVEKESSKTALGHARRHHEPINHFVVFKIPLCKRKFPSTLLWPLGNSTHKQGRPVNVVFELELLVYTEVGCNSVKFLFADPSYSKAERLG